VGYVSVHAPVDDAAGHWPRVVKQLLALPPRVETIVIHPDLVTEEDVRTLAPLGERVCFENMDCGKAGGRFADELVPVFELVPDAGFCLDVAHVLTHDESLGLALELLERLGDRLRQVHVSGIEADGTHRPTTIEDLRGYAPVLERCRHVPLILEATIEP
jgi:hypothetical protein